MRQLNLTGQETVLVIDHDRVLLIADDLIVCPIFIFEMSRVVHHYICFVIRMEVTRIDRAEIYEVFFAHHISKLDIQNRVFVIGSSLFFNISLFEYLTGKKKRKACTAVYRGIYVFYNNS